MSAMPLLPDPGVTENGYTHCNEPLYVGVRVGYCAELVKRQGTRFRRPGWHKGPHRIEWWGESKPTVLLTVRGTVSESMARDIKAALQRLERAAGR